MKTEKSDLSNHLILSRKGLDSVNGGQPSVILDDGRMVSIPIPEPRPKVNAQAYIGMRFDGAPFVELLARVGLEKLEYFPAHVDPDLIFEFCKKPKGWRGSFGQVDAAESHLRSHGVGPGSLFLFWGWFEHEKGYRKSKGFHAIFGYLEVDFVVDVGRDGIPNWAYRNPHFDPDYPRIRNRVYIARKRLSMDSSKPGWGVFNFSPDLRLSIPGGVRSNWRLPACFSPESGCSISHLDPSRFSKVDKEVTDVAVPGRGQEFVCQRTKQIDKWLAKLFKEQTIWTPSAEYVKSLAT